VTAVRDAGAAEHSGQGWGAFQVTVAYGRRTALDKVTLEVPAGEVAAVVGGDGAGKTTLLRTLAGALTPTSGRLMLPELREVGYLPTAGGLWRDLTVAENMRFVGAAYGIKGRQLARRGDEILQAAGLENALDRTAGNLSGGMRQKLSFCLAILHQPQMLVLDEPSTGVDPVSRVDLWRLIATAAADGAGVAMATTYLDEAERAANVLVLDQGRALRSGTAKHITDTVPGTITATGQPADPSLAWRRGRIFHAWHPGPPRPGEHPLTPDMEDAVIVAALNDRLARTPASAHQGSLA
jgi:ABC-type multidrug transport system ATPase subunit